MAISRTPAVPGTAREVPLSPAAARRPFRDNPRLILVGILLLLAALASLLWLADRSARLSPDFLAGFVLYALSATNFMMLLALGFFLVRNVVKLVVERRRALPFARFRAKLVALLLGLTLVPAVLVLAVGSQVVLTAVDRWFNAPMDEVLSSASTIASDYYLERRRVVSDEVGRLAQALSRVDLANDVDGVRAVDRARRHPAADRAGAGLPRRRRPGAVHRWSTSRRPTCRPASPGPAPIAWPR